MRMNKKLKNVLAFGLAASFVLTSTMFHCWKAQKQKRWKLFCLMTVRSSVKA